MKPTIPTSRPWWASGAFFAYLGASAFVIGCGVLVCAPDVADVLRGILP